VSDADVLSLQITMARFETKLDSALAGQVDHEDRMRRLERLVWIASGFASACGAGAGATLSQLITRHP
jgi:hypothetical protein